MPPPAAGRCAVKCLDAHRGGCTGAVELRYALSSTGTQFPRCDGHWAERLREQERINRDYPDSPVPPAWFDPAAAGENWDSDY